MAETMERLARRKTQDSAKRVTRICRSLNTRCAASLKIAWQLTTYEAHIGTIVSAVALVMTETCSPCTLGLGAGSASGRMSGARMNKSPLERRSRPKLAAAECAGRLIG